MFCYLLTVLSYGKACQPILEIGGKIETCWGNDPRLN